MQLKLNSQWQEDVLQVATTGRITARELVGSLDRNPLAELLGPGWASRKVALDMDDTEFVDSAAIGWLIQSHRDFQRAGGGIVLHSIRPPVRQVFDLLKVGAAVPIRDSPAAAKAALSGTAPAAPAGAAWGTASKTA